MKEIVLLASYPKSGNTWLRIVLNTIWNDGRPIDLNKLDIRIEAERKTLDDQLGTHCSELTIDEFSVFRPQLHRTSTAAKDARRFLKVHDAWLPIAQNSPPPFSAQIKTRAVYLVRDPRDVAVSFANHMNLSLEEIIRVMNSPAYTLGTQNRSIDVQVPQLLSTWSAHVTSWITRADIPVHVVRYEDMLEDPESVFSDVLRFVGHSVPEDVLRKTITVTSFEALQQMERNNGFRERPLRTKQFFRRGIAGGWHASLNEHQAERICKDHYNVMKWLGYLGPGSKQ